MAVAEILTALNDAKQDIKNALAEKGVTPTGGLSTYADAVRGITGEPSGGNQFPTGIRFAFSTFTEAPYFDTSAVTDFSKMFYDCYLMQKIPQYDTSNATTMEGMFYECWALKEIPLLDCSKVTRFEPFEHTLRQYINLEFVGGFKELGKSITDNNGVLASNRNVDFAVCKMTRSSALNVFNNLYDLNANNRSALTIKISDPTMELLDDEDIAIATTKGWNVTV